MVLAIMTDRILMRDVIFLVFILVSSKDKSSDNEEHYFRYQKR